MHGSAENTWSQSNNPHLGNKKKGMKHSSFNAEQKRNFSKLLNKHFQYKQIMNHQLPTDLSPLQQKKMSNLINQHLEQDKQAKQYNAKAHKAYQEFKTVSLKLRNL